jgi:hypothetical protein
MADRKMLRVVVNYIPFSLVMLKMSLAKHFYHSNWIYIYLHPLCGRQLQPTLGVRSSNFPPGLAVSINLGEACPERTSSFGKTREERELGLEKGEWSLRDTKSKYLREWFGDLESPHTCWLPSLVLFISIVEFLFVAAREFSLGKEFLT